MRNFGVTYDNVVHIVVLDLGGQINIDLNPVLRILFFNGVQERVEPFGTPKVSDNPGKVDFGEASGLGIVEVVHSVPNRLEDPTKPPRLASCPHKRKHGENLRSKRSDANTSADQKDCLILEEILAGTSERTINHDPGQNPADRRDNETSLLLGLVLGIEVTSTRLGESASEVPNDPDVHAQVILLRSGGEGERVPLEVRDLRARKEDVLASSNSGLFLLNLKFHDLGRVLDDLGDVSPVTGSDFTEYPFGDPDQAANEPIALRSKSVKRSPKERGTRKIRTQNTPMVLGEQKGGRSGFIMQNMPWSCQLMKKTMNKWCEYQKRSKLALRLFSIANQTMSPRESHMIHPVIPGPVVKLVNKKIINLSLGDPEDAMARLAKLTM